MQNRLLRIIAFRIKTKMETKNNISYMNSEQSKLVDELLMGDIIGYSVEQPMEIAGLSVALAIDKTNREDWKSVKKILNISGPGNNGGDGLVASRYLKEFNYEVDILYPKKTDKELYKRLVKQCEAYEIKILNEEVIEDFDSYDLIIDSIFGYSFSGDIRSPFDKIINKLNTTKARIASIDIPSGWDVDKGNIKNIFNPQLLISLTFPKLGSQGYNGIHYLGGRFAPPSIYNKLNLITPKYKNSEMIIRI